MKTFRTLIENYQPTTDNNKKLDEYRKAIKDKFGIDIEKFTNNKIKGGKSNSYTFKDLIKFDLKQIIKGIEIEQEHTADKYIALEITLDHLAEFKHYYIPYLEDMEKIAK